MDPKQIENLGALADTVAAEHSDLEAAIAAERHQCALLLSAVVDKVRPSLRALSSSIHSRVKTFWVTDALTDAATEVFPWRGVRVWGAEGPQERIPQANEGAYEGETLYLVAPSQSRPPCTDFALVEWSGHWSRWQGATSAWEGIDTPWTCEQVAERVGISGAQEILNTLEAALQSHLGSRKKASKRAVDRAERLAALARLL